MLPDFITIAEIIFFPAECLGQLNILYYSIPQSTTVQLWTTDLKTKPDNIEYFIR
jgi:hypothetical protein